MTRPRWTKSLRFQLTFWYVATLAAILAPAAGLLLHGAHVTLLRETDQALTGEADRIAQAAAPAPAEATGEQDERPDPAAIVAQSNSAFGIVPGIGSNPLLVRLVRADSGRTIALSPASTDRDPLADALAAAPIHPGLSFVGPDEERRMRCLSLPLPNTLDTLQVATPWDPTEDLLTHLSWGLGLTLTLLLLLSAVGGWQLVGRALRPIDEIVTEAERLTADRLTPTALQPRALSDNEVGHLVVALNAMLTRLHTALAAQRQFTADASHELRTPLTILQGEIETALSRERPIEEYRRVLGSGLEETARMARIVDSLGFLARGDAAPTPSTPTQSVPVRLSELTAIVAESLRLQAEQVGLKLVLDLQPDVTVFGIADDLRRVVSNLLDNAIHYTAPGGTITLSLKTVPQACHLRVVDTGRGISAEDLPRIFDRFYRADKARVNDGGSGLGLAIVEHIVAEHGGRIDVQSALGQGSAFTVSLPHD